MINEPITVETAVREKTKASAVLIGPSGSGKTAGALLLAKGILMEMYKDQLTEDELIKKIGIVDTEHKRSLIFANNTIGTEKIGQFKVVALGAPYTVNRYQTAVMALVKAGCEVVIVDSISHEWEGIGGILEQQQEAGGQFKDWKVVKPDMEQFSQLITANSKVHVICTCRTKQGYAMQPDETGKMQVEKLGLKPIQKDDLEYEYITSLRIDMDHLATAAKDGTNIFGRKPELITTEHGRKLYLWANDGVDIEAERQEKIKAMQEKVNQYFAAGNDYKKQITFFEMKANKKLRYFEPYELEALLTELEKIEKKGNK